MSKQSVSNDSDNDRKRDNFHFFLPLMFSITMTIDTDTTRNAIRFRDYSLITILLMANWCLYSYGRGRREGSVVFIVSLEVGQEIMILFMAFTEQGSIQFNFPSNLVRFSLTL